MMRKYITRINGIFADSRLLEQQVLISGIAEDDGWIDMGLYVYPNASESNESRSARLDGIIAGVNNGDIAVIQLPTGNGLQWEQTLISHLKAYGVRIILLFHTLDSTDVHNNRSTLPNLINICNLAEAIIVPSFEMIDTLKGYGLRGSISIILHECWDASEDNALAKEGYYTRKALGTALEALLSMNSSSYMLVNRFSIRSHNVGRFTYSTVRESYFGKTAISYQYDGEADGISVVSDEKIIWQTDDIKWHYALIEMSEGIEYHLEAFVYTSRGKLTVARSESLVLSNPIYDHNSPKISIVIPTYNSQNFIARTIDNVLAQSQRDIELIVVDDGSSDETVTIVEWYCQRYSNVQIYKKKNGGQAEARNLGVDIARGTYIGFMDHDDLLPVRAMELLYNSITENDTDISFGAVEEFSAIERRILLHNSFQNNRRITPDEYLENCRGVVIWNKLYKAKLCKENKFGPRIFEDNAWTPTVISYADSLSCIQETVYEFDQSRVTENQRIQKLPPNELQQFFRDAVLFPLREGNPDRLEILRRNAIISCNIWKNKLPDYTALLQEIMDFKN